MVNQMGSSDLLTNFITYMKVKPNTIQRMDGAAISSETTAKSDGGETANNKVTVEHIIKANLQKKDGLKNIAVKAYSRRENLIPINSGLKTSTILTVICLVLVQVVEASGLTLAEIS